jgi:hypothetical protein
MVGQTVIRERSTPVLRFASLPRNCDADEEIDSMSLLACRGIGLVREVKLADQKSCYRSGPQHEKQPGD